MKAVARSAMRVLLRADDFLTKCINRLAIEYDGGVHVKHRLMKYHDFFVERISPGERVLDVGCGDTGTGRILELVGPHIERGLGIDMSLAMLAVARDRLERAGLRHCTVRQGDIYDLPVPKESFDVIMLSNILEHIEQRVEFLTIVHERLSPQRCLIRVPMFNRDWRVPLREELAMSYFSDPTHYTEYTQESFEKEIRAAGLTITHLQINWGEIWAEVRPGRS